VFTGSERIKGDTTKLPLAAGEQLTVSPRAPPHAVPANLASATAWTQRKLVFEHRPLGEVAEEFNRYNLERIEIDSPELRSEEITGVFEANNPESFMSFLAKLPDVSIERSPGENRLIVTRAGSGTP
jgi:transmembrane sensor